MQLIYIHGLDSNAHAVKGQLLKDYCAKYFPHITVHTPDLNCSPDKAMTLLNAIIAQDPDTGLVGSSLGGFYATMLCNLTGKRTVLLNPSVHSNDSLKRFFSEDFASLPEDYVGHTTPDGWAITKADIEWLTQHRANVAKYPNKIMVIVKQGDELLDYRDAVAFFSQANAQSHIVIEPDGDHRMTDFASKLPQVVQFLFGVVAK